LLTHISQHSTATITARVLYLNSLRDSCNNSCSMHSRCRLKQRI